MYESQLTTRDLGSLYLLDVETRGGNATLYGPHTVRTLGMVGTGIMSQGRGVAGHDHAHALTLPYVHDGVRIEGLWPEPVSLSRGWARARARPWNDETSDAFLRLDRGGYDFLTSATESIARLAGASVYSPALYRSSTRVWRKAGYEPSAELEIMERSVSSPSGEPSRPITEAETPDWDRIQEIDDAAFEGFWRMSLAGLREALSSTRRADILEARHGGVLIGYAIVGAQWDVSYLQRIAVAPDHVGQQIGSDLVRAALRWGHEARTRVMILNVRSVNERARRLYVKEGFARTATKLHLLRYEGVPTS